MFDDEHTAPGEPGTGSGDNGQGFGPDDEQDEELGTNLADREMPTSQADPEIKLERIIFRAMAKGAGFMGQLTLETSASPHGVVALAAAVAVVASFTGGIAALLIAVSAPSWLALTMAVVPAAAFYLITWREGLGGRRISRSIMGRKRESGLRGIDASQRDPDDPDKG